jgi:hypothetical protein
MSKLQTGLLAAALGLAAIFGASSAQAKCQTLFYSVNDYGKDGPSRDATDLLEKYIVKWVAEKGIKKYRKTPQAIKCELFLDVVLFDEYTCTASADVCW